MITVCLKQWFDESPMFWCQWSFYLFWTKKMLTELPIHMQKVKTWQCMKMLKELWTKQLHDNNILLIMKCFAYRYIPLLPNVPYMQYIQYMHGLMSSCNNNLYTCGEILDLSQNSVDFAPRGPVVILNVAV